MKNSINLLLCLSFLLLTQSCDLFEEPADKETELTGGMQLDFATDLQNMPSYDPSIGGAIAISSQHDLSPLMPPVGDQKQQASCVAWAAGYYIQSYNQKKEYGHNYSLSTLLSPSFLYNQTNIAALNGGGNCLNAASQFQPVLSFMKNTGISSLQEMPYIESDCTNQPSALVTSSAFANRIREYNTVFYNVIGVYNINAANRIKHTKENITIGNPVLIAYEIDRNWAGASSMFNYTGSEPIVYSAHSSNQDIILHASVVVGYDDSKAAFKVINSWGDNWANQGYFWISYDFYTEIVKTAIVIEDEINSGSSNTCIESMTDPRDGQSYCTITIGNQTWMAENLNYQSPNSVCFDNNAFYCIEYSRMYLWEEFMNGASSSNNIPSGVQGICPNGWHVPSQAEWQVLFSNYSSTSEAYSNLIEGGASGFNAIKGGYGLHFSSAQIFSGLGSVGYYWSSTQLMNGIQYYYVFTSDNIIQQNNGDYIMHCRCVQD